MKTPIFIDFEDTYLPYLATTKLNLFEQDPVDITTEELDPILAEEQHILAPRYFVKISPPANNPGPTLTINIHKSTLSTLRNQLRVALNPSIGYGINACYYISYYEWFPLIGFPKAHKTVKKVLEEWWYVPTIDKQTYIPMFPFDPRFQWDLDIILVEPFDTPLLVEETLNVYRTNGTGVYYDEIRTREHSHIFFFDPNDQSIISSEQLLNTESFPYNNETSKWKFSEYQTANKLTRDPTYTVGGAIVGNVEVTLKYIKPFHPSQITIQPEYLNLLV